MNLKEREVNVVIVEAYCDCGGKLVPTGVILTSDPPQYPHKCEKCPTAELLSKRYPAREFREKR